MYLTVKYIHVFISYYFQKDGLTDVLLSDVTEEGIATVQILSETLTFLKSLLDEANKTLSEDPQKYAIKSTNELVGGIFLAKYNLDNRWHRATVQKCEGDDKVSQAAVCVRLIVDTLLKMRLFNADRSTLLRLQSYGNCLAKRYRRYAAFPSGVGRYTVSGEAWKSV